jgi:putative MATE family efflux protein
MNIQLSDHFTYGKLIKFTLPSIIAAIFSSVYSLVDSFFISNFAGKTPFAAIHLISPVLLIFGLVGVVFGAGGTALVAKTYGEGDKEKANSYFSLFVLFAFLVGIVLALSGFVFAPQITALLGAEGTLLKDCIAYARIILSALPFYLLQIMFQSFFVVAEKPKLGLAVTVIAGLTNVALDALLVLLLPQDLKLIGAAIATAVAQAIGGILPLIYFLTKNSSILRLGKTTFDGKALLRAATNGSSQFMASISSSVVGLLYNAQLMKYAGENGLAAYGAVMSISTFFVMMFSGFSSGVAPVIGYHNGAKNRTELRGILRKSLTLIAVCGMITAGVAEILATPLSSIYVGYDAELLKFTVSGFRIFAPSFVFIGFGFFTAAFFTALNDGLTAAIISFLRTFIFQCGAIIAFPLLLGMNGIWISYVFAEVMSFVLGVSFILARRKKFDY